MDDRFGAGGEAGRDEPLLPVLVDLAHRRDLGLDSGKSLARKELWHPTTVCGPDITAVRPGGEDRDVARP